MKAVSKFITGAAAAALLTVAAASPAEARDRWGRHDGVDAGAVIAGVAILGGIAAIAAAVGNDGGRYGYDSRSRYRDGYSAAVSACGYEADRAGRGRVSGTDVDRRGNDSYRVRGTIEGGGYGYDRGYERYDRGYDRGADTRGYDRTAFTCVARGDGRIADFRINDGYRW
jgi:hypothetical protein